MKICGFWIDFEADFKPSILKQDKADQCHKAHTKDDDRLYRKGRYHQATDFGGGAGRTYGGAGSDCGERDLQPLQFLWANATAIYISHRLSSCVSIPSPYLITQGWWKAARIQRFWLPTANMQRCGTRRQSIMCSLQQYNNAAPGENEKMKEKAKSGSGFIDIRPKMWFDIHRALWYCKDSRGAHKTASDCKMTFCDNVMLLTAGGDFYE